MAYIECNCLQKFHELTADGDTPAALRPVLSRLCALYGLWSLSSHMATLYQGVYDVSVHWRCLSESHCGNI